MEQTLERTYTAPDGTEVTATFDVKLICDVFGNDLRNVLGKLIADMQYERRGFSIEGGPGEELWEKLKGEEYTRFEKELLMLLYQGKLDGQ